MSNVTSKWVKRQAQGRQVANRKEALVVLSVALWGSKDPRGWNACNAYSGTSVTSYIVSDAQDRPPQAAGLRSRDAYLGKLHHPELYPERALHHRYRQRRTWLYNILGHDVCDASSKDNAAWTMAAVM